VPLRALGLRAGLLGPDSCPLTLLGWVRIKGRVRDQRPVGATQPASPLFLRPPSATRGGGCWGPSASEGPQKHDLTMFSKWNM
jgi:hypothetical protein